MRDHSGLVVDSFRGTFDRGEEETVPIDHFLSSQNIRFIKGGVTTRYGTSLAHAIASARRIAIYERTGEAKRLLILNNTNQLYDSTDLATPILTVTGMTDFSTVTIFNRAYITPHNGLTGLPGEKVYVYNGTTCRAAAGTGPSDPSGMVVSGTGSGNIEKGFRVFAVAFESPSGFISQIGAFAGHTTPSGDESVTLAPLPIGPAGTVARILFATKEIIDFNGDYGNQTYYFIPDGRVANNIDTSVSGISFFDADLSDSANYLVEQLAVIPSGVGIGLIAGRMIVWGEDLNNDTIRGSAIGEPESINAVDGFLLANPGDSGGGVRNCCEYHGQIIIFKSQRCYSALPTPDPLAFWAQPQEIDASVGTECHGLARALDGGHTIQEGLFIADRAGLRYYSGVFVDSNVLTYDVDDIWGRIPDAYFHTVEVAIDTVESIIYIALPLDAETSPNQILVGDYSEGLSIEGIRWTLWSFPQAATSIVVQVISSVPTLKVGSLTGNVYKLDPTVRVDVATTIDNWVEFPYLPAPEIDDYHNHFTGARFRVKGDGTLLVTGKYPQKDTTTVFSGDSITLAASGRNKFSGFNVVSEHCSVKARINASGKYFTLTKYILYAGAEWGDVD